MHVHRLICLLVIGATTALFLACGGAASTSVSPPTSTASSSTAKSSPAGPAATTSPTIEDKIKDLRPEQKRYVELMVGTRRELMNLDPRALRPGEIGRIIQPVKVFQVVDSRSFTAMFGGEVVWFSKLDTSNLVDGRAYDMSELGLFVDGTRRYVTALGGTKQVISVEVLNSAQLDQIIDDELERLGLEEMQKLAELEARETAEKLAREKRIDDAKWRTWTSADGAFSAEAKFLRFGGGMVTLEKRNGKVITVTIEQLVDADADFIRTQPWKQAAQDER